MLDFVEYMDAAIFVASCQLDIDQTPELPESHKFFGVGQLSEQERARRASLVIVGQDSNPKSRRWVARCGDVPIPARRF